MFLKTCQVAFTKLHPRAIYEIRCILEKGALLKLNPCEQLRRGEGQSEREGVGEEGT